MTSILRAPARPEVLIGWMQYGSVTGARSHPRGRLWLIAASADPSAVLTARCAYNDPVTGRVVYEELGEVRAARLRGDQRAELALVDGTSVAMVAAPCVCGAGAVGYAGPGPDKSRLTYVNLRGHLAVQFV